MKALTKHDVTVNKIISLGERENMKREKEFLAKYEGFDGNKKRVHLPIDTMTTLHHQQQTKNNNAGKFVTHRHHPV